jgi:HK97 gp10 family phage protein
MAETISVTITGGDEIARKLEELAPRVGRKIIRSAMRQSAALWLEEMRRLAPRGPAPATPPGFLADHLITRLKVAAGGFFAVAHVGPQKIDYPRRPSRRNKKGRTVDVRNVALWFEYGTRKMAAKPFLRPAYESQKGSVLARFIEIARGVLQSEARQ